MDFFVTKLEKFKNIQYETESKSEEEKEEGNENQEGDEEEFEEEEESGEEAVGLFLVVIGTKLVSFIS